MQSICLEDRKNLSLVGVTKIISSTNTQAAVEIGDDTLVITGTDLEITKLSLENKEVSFAGTINSLKFGHKAEKKGFFKRIFK